MSASRYRNRILLAAVVALVVGVALLGAGTVWLLWRQARALEHERAGSLAERVGQRAEGIFLDARQLLRDLDQSELPRCGPEHLAALQRAAAERPWVRAIGYWRAAERRCGVGLVAGSAPTPPKADRLYPSGVLAWWPSPATDIGGVSMFLIRDGNHDVAIDPRLLVDTDPLGQREAVLWVEGRRLAASPPDARVPSPEDLPEGLSFDPDRNRLLSHVSVAALLPIRVVAAEPLETVWQRRAGLVLTGIGSGFVLLVGWLSVVLWYSRRRLGIAQRLRMGIARGEIRVHYQPIVDLETRRCVGAEALARWEPRGEARIGPDVFIPAAEQAGLAHEITRAVLRRVVVDYTRLAKRQPGLFVNVNLSAEDLEQKRLTSFLDELVEQPSIDPVNLKFEITERGLVNSDEARACIHALRARGHRVAVDDFGTGYSSLAYLQSFELDVLKIDRIFVEAIGTESATREVVPHLITMARDLGLEIVAEGVQTEAQRRWLLDHGVRLGQGYLFAPALPFEDFARGAAVPPSPED